MQLVAYGAQDIYLTGNPQITFFKVVYRRHTNFSMEAIEQTMNGTTDVSSDNQTATCTISRNGDLIHKVYVTTDDFPSGARSDYEGSKLIKEVELEIGGQRIDRHYTEWNQVWEELCTSESKAIGLKAMKGDIGTRTSLTAGTSCKHIQVPLNFWFCRNVGLALPLIALQYHEVKLKFQWAMPSGDSSSVKCNVIVDYIYLDTDERRRFAQVSHEYLIEQIQRFETTAPDTANHSVNLNFNHPVKELIWTNDAFIETAGTGKVQLKLNGHDRFSERHVEYFQLRQPYEYHTAVPRQNLPSGAQLTSNVVEKQEVTFTDIVDVDDAAQGAATVAAGGIAVVASDNAPGNGGSASGTEMTDGDTLTTAGVGYIVNKDDLGDKLFVGRLYEITLSGSAATTGAAGGTIFATLTNKITGPGSSGYADTTTFLQFNKLLILGTATAAMATAFANAAGVDAGNVLDITEINEFVPKANLITQARTSKMTRKINVYSFGLKPEEHQPSGTCNFSRIDSAKLNFTGLAADAGSGDNRKINIYAVNYNVLRIMSGMGGLAYSN